ncbi:hypothetical protein D0Y65_019835 [Glycine soja]|uniref:DUF7870 domain-containing protein n=1 Tax=Glycine soja TaxID=3848 RepID=A0A445JB39_GLYSO|nr:hypothetical protein D0Y65_019835 [Glycine soja]
MKATDVALRKIGLVNDLVDSSPKRKLCQLATRVKRNALKGLEDALLEPPRDDFAKPNKIKYLLSCWVILLKVTREESSLVWACMRKIELRLNGLSRTTPKRVQCFRFIVSRLHQNHMDVSAWLTNHVKEEEFVVMKAEAGRRNKSGRTYWECLALYGRLRDEGVAVHQWWN